MTETKWQRDGDWVGALIEDSYVMVHIETGQYIGLNQTANAIWQALETPRTVAELSTLLCEQYDVAEDECAAAVNQALDDMRQRQLVSLV